MRSARNDKSNIVEVVTIVVSDGGFNRFPFPKGEGLSVMKR